MINTKLQSIIDTKSAIGNAIVNKGGTITSETPFFNYAAQIDGISTGTPQTIFEASDGSKWALTNAVNLVNDAGNVTHDFNYWQPANNSTSDPILNVGTVNGNISGNIRIVQVNQVNISQYENIVATDTLGGKYVGYNGYDSQTNPTPTGNVVFNRWLLNNSASGTVIFANTTIVNGGTFNGPNSSFSEGVMDVVNNVAYGDEIGAIGVNNSFVYAVGAGGSVDQIKKYHESNLVFNNNSVSYGGRVDTLGINNGFIYIGGQTNNTVQKFGESNLTRVGNTANYSGAIFSLTTNNSFIYAAGAGNNTVQKFHESNLVRVGNANNYGGFVFKITTNNSFIYAVGEDIRTIKKWHESNLVFVNNSVSYGADVFAMTINNGFIYIGGGGAATVQKFYENNLAFVGNTVGYGGTIRSLTTNNGFIYAGGTSSQGTKKYFESNLIFVGQSSNKPGTIKQTLLNNGFIFRGADSGQVQKLTDNGTSVEQLQFYTATKIKE
jgi:hypothetical protein